MSNPLHIMLPLRLNERDRDRNRHRKHRTSSSSSSQPIHRHRKHRSSYGSTRLSTKDPERENSTAQSSTPSPTFPTSSRRFSMPAVDDPAASFLESRTSLPYPNFSKAHSKEFVGNPDPPTPDPTDLTETQQKEDRHHTENGTGNNNHHAPPSPPLTGLDQHSRKGSSVSDKQEKKEESTERPKAKIRIRTGSNRSSSSLRSKEEEGKSTRTMRPETPKFKMSGSYERDTPSRTASHKPSRSKVTEETTLPKRASTHRDVRSPPRSPAAAGPANGSDATIGPQYRSNGSRRVKTPEKPPSRTQNRSSTSSPYHHRHHNSSGYRTPTDAAYDHGRPPTTNSSFGAPPPPPPPPEVPVSIPRVDYLLQNGGLDRHTHKTLLLGSHYPDIAPPPSYQPHIAAHRIFEPFSSLLDEYQNVMTKNGSLAVATGYRSVARRLLDRLEAVFARDISCESCSCLMCENEDMMEPHPGVSWGEVLELVSGRKELPTWPPFMMAPSVVDTGASGEEHIPMQNMDIDIPEEYREHYVRQSRKTKLAVDKWLSEQAGQATSAPDAVDDDTLTFAMLTHLGSEQRPLFCSLLGISTISPAPSAVGGPSRSRPHALISSASAIQRLYRLSSLPRDPETAIYMLNNPGIHHVLATLSAISDDEWDILISGRFDGFLRSGAEDVIPPVSGSTPRWGSRSNTSFSASQGPTPCVDRPASQPYSMASNPASFGGPITIDEEMEIAALAEVEREIYLGMEALEDAFEALHCKAETVRRTLRERGAGLSVANQNRRGSYVEARMGTPSAVGNGFDSGPEDEFLDDGISLAPDDSASNISSNRRRRPKRRTERRTPAPVEEEDEGEEEPHISRRDRERGSRRR